jgi:hypothetical protein
MPYGIDPFETKEVKIGEITFTIGHVLSRKMLELRAKLVSMKDRIGSAINADDIVGIGDFNYQLIRYAVKGHQNFIVKGKQIDFKTETVNEFGKPRTIVSDETMEFYALNNIIPDLSTEILKFNNVSEQEQKN